MNYKIESLEITMPQLLRERTIWIYAPQNPKEAEQEAEALPVIYVQDGQNLFYEKISQNGSTWKVAETMQKLEKAFGVKAYVVGIESNDKRRGEYCPWVSIEDGKKQGEGKEYAEFLARVLKPKIDSIYHTDKERNATAIVGSGFGALISLYTALSFQRVFESVGVFSIESDFCRQFLFNFISRTQQVVPQHFFVTRGGKEKQNHVCQRELNYETLELYRVLSERESSVELVMKNNTDFSEKSWADCFESFAQNFLCRYFGYFK